MLDGYIDGLTILRQAKTKPKPVGKFVASQLRTKRLLPKLPFTVKNALSGITRTPVDIFKAFNALLGAGTLRDEKIKKEDFYTWINPFGVLVRVLVEWDGATEDKPAHDRWLALRGSFVGLNEAKIPRFKVKGPFDDASALIQSTAYKAAHKNKLNPLITAFDAHNLLEVVNQTKKLVAEDIAAHREFATEMNKFIKAVTPVMIAMLVKELDEFNKADRQIVGLPIEGNVANRNAQVYASLQGVVAPLIQMLKPGAHVAKIADLKPDEFTTEVGTVMAVVAAKLEAGITYLAAPSQVDQKRTIKAAIKKFLDTFIARLRNLKEASAGIAAEVTTGPPGAPPPSPGRRIPMPPPPPPSIIDVDDAEIKKVRHGRRRRKKVHVAKKAPVKKKKVKKSKKMCNCG